MVRRFRNQNEHQLLSDFSALDESSPGLKPTLYVVARLHAVSQKRDEYFCEANPKMLDKIQVRNLQHFLMA